MFLSDLNLKEQGRQYLSFSEEVKDCYGVITEVDIYDKNTFLVDRTVLSAFSPQISTHC